MTEEYRAVVAFDGTTWMIIDIHGNVFATLTEVPGHWVPPEARARIIARLLNKNPSTVNDELVITTLERRILELEQRLRSITPPMDPTLERLVDDHGFRIPTPRDTTSDPTLDRLISEGHVDDTPGEW